MRFQKRIFTKKDLKPGMVVLRRDGYLCIVNEDCSRLIRKKGHLYLHRIDEELNAKGCSSDFDIIKVYSTTQKNEFIDDKKLLYEINEDLLKLIWKK